MVDDISSKLGGSYYLFILEHNYIKGYLNIYDNIHFIRH